MTNPIFLESCHNSLGHRLDEQCIIQWHMHYLDVEMKVTHESGVAWITVRQQKNVYWKVSLQALFLYFQDEVTKKKQSWKIVYGQTLGLFFHKTRREP